MTSDFFSWHWELNASLKKIYRYIKRERITNKFIKLNKIVKYKHATRNKFCFFILYFVKDMLDEISFEEMAIFTK